MNIEEYPKEIKEDIEDVTLAILEHIKDRIIVIGGWAVRAHLGNEHSRHTLDVDSVAGKEDIPFISAKLKDLDLREDRTERGIRFLKPYRSTANPNGSLKGSVKKHQIRIDISEPRIGESGASHYFEFDLTDFVLKEMAFHNTDRCIMIRVPPIEQMAAVKLGLPVDYRNNLDCAALLQRSDIRGTIEIIKKNDDWRVMVLRRMPKLIGRIRQPGRLENKLAINAGINIGDHVRKLRRIEKRLRG